MPAPRDHVLSLVVRSALMLAAWGVGLELADWLFRWIGWLEPVEPTRAVREFAWRASAAFIGGGLFGLLRLRFSDTPGGRAAAGSIAGFITGGMIGAANALLGSSVPVQQLIPASILGGFVGGALLSGFAAPLTGHRESPPAAG